MRQLGDLLVWVVMVAILMAVLYATPRITQFMSDESRPSGMHNQASY
jgi:hypothetical protein